MPSPLRFHLCETPLGWVSVTLSDKGLHSITLPLKTRDAALNDAMEIGASEPATPSEATALEHDIVALVTGKPITGSLTLDWTGITPFRRAVLEACTSIPAGETRTYAWLAQQVGKPAAARAAGRVMATNPWPLLVPCHRVLGSNGTLHGYGGGLDMKEALLQAEGVASRR